MEVVLTVSDVDKFGKVYNHSISPVPETWTLANKHHLMSKNAPDATRVKPPQKHA